MNATLSKEQIEARLALETEALGNAIDDLRERARAEFDLRSRVRERPSAWLAGALALGIWMGGRR